MRCKQRQRLTETDRHRPPSLCTHRTGYSCIQFRVTMLRSTVVPSSTAGRLSRCSAAAAFLRYAGLCFVLSFICFAVHTVFCFFVIFIFPSATLNNSDNDTTIPQTMFSVTAVQTAFRDAQIRNGDVDIRNYVLAYQELCKFCSRLGALFGFVVNDLQDKIGHLNQLIDDDELNFCTVHTMILFEKSNDKLKGSSGCVTLLRLHRGLEFIIQFMSKVITLQPAESTTYAAQEAYSQTLARYHSWFVRQGALLAMNLLPSQKILYHQTVGDECVEETLNQMPDMISEASIVHKRINILFSDNNILNLP